MNYYAVVYSNDLCHYGVKGQKWGVRRYQNPDGTLTAAGKKRQQNQVASNRNATIAKGTKLYRVSDKGTSDTSDGKIYVSATKETGDFYIRALGKGKIYKTGKAYAQEYIAKTDLKLPDRRTMEKIELGLLKDKQVQRELVDSLMKKGLSREKATEQVAPYNVGKAFIDKLGTSSLLGLVGATYGAVGGAYMGLGNPLAVAIGAGTGAVAGVGAGVAAPSQERTRALNVARVSYGDKENKTINDKLSKELSKRGYNAMKDYNDRRAFGDKGNQAVIVFDSNKNITLSRASEIKARDYGEAYARNYLKEHPKSKLSFEDLVKDGESEYKKTYESGVINRKRAEENKRILEDDKKDRLSL